MPARNAVTAVEALELAGAIGPYFALTVNPDDEPPWRPFSDLTTAAVLRANVDAVRSVLAERTGLPVDALDLRACASTHLLGLAARIVAPVFGAAALTGQVVALDLAHLRWQEVIGGPLPIAVVDPTTTSADLYAATVVPVITPLVQAFGSTFSLSPQVLWGNVASAVAGAATMLIRSDVETLLDPLVVARTLTTSGSLADMGQWTSAGFVRNNCCLFYKIPGGGTCGDCVLR